MGMGQCPFISDSVCANSRTQDIGKARGLIWRLFPGFCKGEWGYNMVLTVPLGDGV